MEKCVIITENSEYMKPLLLIQHDSSEVLVNSSLMIIKGESGSGKSRLALNLMSGFAGVEDNIGFSYDICPDNKYIVYVSTEMSKYHLQKRLLKLIEVVGEKNKSKLLFVDCFEEPDKLKSLNSICEQYSPHVIILDQVADLVPSVNDEVAGKKLVESLSRISNKYDCGLIAIIHQNEDSNANSKARGHLGSCFEQKIVSALAIADNSKGFRIRSTKLREGKHFVIDTEYNEITSMLKRVDTVNDDEILNMLELPNNKSKVCEQIGKILKVTAYKTQEKTLVDLVRKGLLKEEKLGKFAIYNKVNK